MTLCIAARCYDGGPVTKLPLRYATDAVVVSSDTHAVAGALKEDNAGKFLTLSPYWCCLIAGDLPQGHALAHAIGRELSKETQPNELTIPDRIRSGAKGLRMRQYIVDHFNVSYDDVFSPASGAPEDVRARILSSAEAFNASAEYPKQELIFVGWTGERFSLYLYFNGDVQPQNNYLTIGSGAQHAEMMLNMGAYRYFTRIDEAVYRVYEAQRIGTVARDVGRQADFSVLRYDVRQQSVVALKIEAFAEGFLSKTFDEMMPKRPEGFKLDDGIVPGAWDAWSFRYGERGIGYNTRGQETDIPKGEPGDEEADGA